MSETIATPAKKFMVETTETVGRTYLVEADDDKQARKRLRLHFDDPGVLREGMIIKQAKEEIKHRRVVGAKSIPLASKSSESPHSASEKV